MGSDPKTLNILRSFSGHMFRAPPPEDPPHLIHVQTIFGFFYRVKKRGKNMKRKWSERI